MKELLNLIGLEYESSYKRDAKLVYGENPFKGMPHGVADREMQTIRLSKERRRFCDEEYAKNPQP